MTEQAEQVTETPIDQEQPQEEVKHEGFIALGKHQKDVNVQHKKFRDEERARKKAEDTAGELQKQLDELNIKRLDTEIPAVPNPDSLTYEDDVAKRDEALKQRATHDIEKKRLETDQQTQQNADQAKQKEIYEQQVAGFDANTVKHGLSLTEVNQAAATLNEYGLSKTFQDIVVEDPDGPLFVKYLSNNPVEFEQLNSMSPYQLMTHLNGDIRQKAALLKPQTSGAPPPPVSVEGGGVPEQAEWWEKGGKYS